MTDTANRDWLSFAEVIPSLRGAASQPWVLLRGKLEERLENCFNYSALIPSTRLTECLDDPNWELRPGDGAPDVWSHGDEHIYYRTGSDNGVEPLLRVRTFSGTRPATVELLEEFRLFHNLWLDEDTRDYLKFDSAGDANVITKHTDSAFEIMARPVRQFMAWTGSHLALYVVWNRYSEKTLAELSFTSRHQEIIRDASSAFTLTIAPCGFQPGFKTIGRLTGKVLVPPLARQHSGWGPYQDEPQYQSFIVGLDSDGKEIELSCAPEVSDDSYLAAVWFRAEVLKKYQSEPERYAVTDGQVNCQGHWDLPVDNDHKDHVAAFLGDLRMLPEAEQRHWRAFNIAPASTLSETATRRSFHAEWATSNRPEHQFARAYEALTTDSEKQGVQIIRPLGLGDEYALKTLHVPYTDAIIEFDQEVLKLTKLLVDSINDTELEKHITVAAEDKSISKLEKFFVAKGRNDHTAHTAMLRDLQRYRSQNAAHRRGRDAHKSFTRLAPGVLARREVLAAVLTKATSLLEFIREVQSTIQEATLAPTAARVTAANASATPPASATVTPGLTATASATVTPGPSTTESQTATPTPTAPPPPTDTLPPTGSSPPPSPTS
jgi:hypothetical protein